MSDEVIEVMRDELVRVCSWVVPNRNLNHNRNLNPLKTVRGPRSPLAVETAVPGHVAAPPPSPTGKTLRASVSPW
jgi:hypothetical protein